MVISRGRLGKALLSFRLRHSMFFGGGKMAKIPLPYGAWPSQLSAAAVAGGSLRLGRIEVFQGVVYWSEGRPDEGGRTTLMRVTRGGQPAELLPAPWSARSRVHEYGGGEFHVTTAGVFFVNDKDQQIHVVKDDRAPVQVTDAPRWRFADFAFDAARNRLIAVAEIHSSCLEHPKNVLAAIDLQALGAKAVSILREGADFYASPRISHDSGHIAWLEWNLPHMPWDNAAIVMATLDTAGELKSPLQTAGGVGYAAFHPEWSSKGALFYVADEADRGDLNRLKDGVTDSYGVNRDCMRSQWSFNLRSYALLDDGRAALTSINHGAAELGLLNLRGGDYEKVDTRLRTIEHVAADGESIVAVGAADTHASAIVSQPLTSGEPYEILRASAKFDLDAADISVGEPVRLTDLDREPVYGVYYPPKNSRFTGMQGARPPVIIVAHGGPTSASARGLKPRTQFFTNRGFAVFDLDYSGSTGYGRDYRRRLDGQWGVHDAADAVAAARHLIATGQGARGKVFLYGSSAGGLTVLMALAKSDVFAGGVSAYGISDLAALQRTTHKFESGYIYGLIGGDETNADERMRERSPLTYADNIKTPVLLLQGLEDKVVPPEQSELIAASLKARGVPCEYIAFEGEGHGFRRAETIARALEAELAFYQSVLK